jgi:hypothetical protein
MVRSLSFLHAEPDEGKVGYEAVFDTLDAIG